jgi:predicted permease
METLLQDIRYAFRTLRRSPGFALIAIVTLAVAIGVNSTVFTFVNGMLFKPLPAHAPQELVALFSRDLKSGSSSEIAWDDYVDYRDRSGVFAGLAGQVGTPMNLSERGNAEMVWGELVTENFWSVLGMQPALGRFFVQADANGPGSDPYAVLSWGFWQKHFAGDPGVIGRAVVINGHPFRVVAVAAPAFKGTRRFGFWPQMWVPMQMHDAVVPGSAKGLSGRGDGFLITVGRLKPGLTLERAQTVLRGFARQLEQAYPASNRNVGATLISARTAFDNPSWTPPRMLLLASSLAMFAVMLILLIASANVANLMLARASARTREVAVRLALGASRVRLVRQFMTESMIIALLGGVGGMLLTLAGKPFQTAMVPKLQFQVGLDTSVDQRVLLFTTLATLATVLLFGLAPGWQATRTNLVPALKNAGSQATVGRRRFQLRDILVIGQVALSLVLLVGGGLFLRSLSGAQDVDVGFPVQSRALLSVNPELQGWSAERTQAFYRQVVRNVEALAEVQSASWAFPVPFDTYGRGFTLYVDGISTNQQDQTIGVSGSVVDTKYFATLGTPLVQGREFTEQDDANAPLVMVVNHAAAVRLWPGKEPVGQKGRLGDASGTEVVVVGVARTGKYNTLGESPLPYVFMPLRQHNRGWMTLVVQTRGDAARALPALKEQIRALDPTLPVFGVMTMEQNVASARNIALNAATLAGVFGAIALILALVGIYGVVAFSVAQRTREVGIRMALGATTTNVLQDVLGRAGILAGLGIVLGLIGALAVSRLLAGLLYGVSAYDTLTFVAVPVALVIATLAASYIPARRATRISPMVALRSE